MNLSFPYDFDARGRTAEPASDEAHIRDLIEQLVFTAPGERLNRPTFGSLVRQLIFAPNSPELAAATQQMVQGALQQWLGELIQVEAVEVESVEAELRVTIRYLLRHSQQRRTVQLRGSQP